MFCADWFMYTNPNDCNMSQLTLHSAVEPSVARRAGAYAILTGASVVADVPAAYLLSCMCGCVCVGGGGRKGGNGLEGNHSMTMFRRITHLWGFKQCIDETTVHCRPANHSYKVRSYHVHQIETTVELSKMDTFGTQLAVLYREVSLLQR